MYSIAKNKITLAVTVILLLITVAALYKKLGYTAPKTSTELYEVQLYQPVSSGWGYRIYRKGTLYIQQEYIPAISGQRHFENKVQAEAIAELVKNKLLNGESPTITLAELEQMGIK